MAAALAQRCMRTPLRFAALAVLATACSPSGSSSSEHAPPELAGPLGAVCDLLDRCPELPPIAAVDRGECIDTVYWALSCRLVETGGTLSVERTMLGLSAEDAAACTAFLSGLGCDDLDCLSDGTCPEGAACLGLVPGSTDDGGGSSDTAGPGERCYRYGTPNCGPGYFCAPTAYDEATGGEVCEICVPLGDVGERCDPSGPRPECRDGLVCIYGTDGLASCEAPRVDGAACNVDADCANGFCRSGTCDPNGEAGDACSSSSDCRWPLGCLGSTCTERRALGEPCTDASDCAGFICHTDGLCGRPLGASCSTGDCRAPNHCDGTCLAPLADGASCPSDDACTSGFCDRTAHTCGPRPPPLGMGGTCALTSDCETGLECLSSVCLRPCGEGCPSGEFCDFDTSPTHCEPARSDGSGCNDDEECASGFCDGSDTCRTRPGLGDPCSGFGECGFRAYCDGGVCVARRGPGQSCSGFEACLQPYVCLTGTCERISLACEPAPIGDQCTYLRFCEADGYCDPSTFRCTPRVGAGAACTPLGLGEDSCAAGLTCVIGAEGASCAPRVAEGAACTGESVCVEGAYCIDGTCQAGMGGNPCDTTEDCAVGLHCDRRMDVCLPPSSEGGPCSYGDGGCAPGLYCDTSDVCVRGGGLGSSCGSFEGCDVGLACIESVCVMRVALGAACRSDFGDPLGSDCIEGAFCDGTTCVARAANGAACSQNEACLSGVCSDSLRRCVVSESCRVP